MAKKKDKKDAIVEEAEAQARAAKDGKKKKKAKKAKKAKKVAKPKPDPEVRVAERIDAEFEEAAPADEEKKASKVDEGLEAIGKLIDHPLVADIVAAGAVAAVASLAERQVTKAKGSSSGSKETLKFAGKAAAAAMGKRFMAEMEAAKAKAATKKKGSGGEEE
ncbi:hypothetical protein [Sphingomicrobium astaxanthinifaciens]|uniref:hypothetical protein n=1 Tax=Sphingomicrobium astaxanthinifaciens TaxID=1227949 RepID=UPI001FCBD796|nr:hypothetical protein [Sphingomicrobium astaxanthinifaciens]MCJ7421854.1 hypothetical protein [Sphingomicrobium astaxanthinifaciens]